MRKIKKQKKKTKLTFRQLIMRTVKTFFFLVFLCLAGAGIWGFKTGFIQNKWKEAKLSFHQTMGQAGFSVDEVFIENRVRTSFAALQKAAAVEQGMPMTQIDIHAMKERIKVLPWVKDVTIERKLPNQLFIRLTERRPIALWQKNGQHHPLDEDGNVIDVSPKGLEYLLITVGEDAPHQTPELINELIKYPELNRRAMSAVRVGGRRWNLILDKVDNGLEIYLPEDGVAETLARLDRLNREHDLLNRQLKRIDLRLPDRLIVQTIDNQPIEPLRPKMKPIQGGHDV